ncbi:hypothetical protein D3C87_1813580 [compost metagenome]
MLDLEVTELMLKGSPSSIPLKPKLSFGINIPLAPKAALELDSRDQPAITSK